MFGLSFEKLILVAVIAAFVVGPHRLPIYAGKLANFTRTLRDLLESTRRNAEMELGVPLRTSEWPVDLRQYDPRKIVGDALKEPPAGPAAAGSGIRPQRN